MNKTFLKVALCLMIARLAVVLGAFGAAPVHFTVDGSTTYEQLRIIHAEQSLNFTKQAMVDSWEVTIWPQDQFEKYVRDNKVPTSIAFTFLDSDHTYINEYFLIWASDAQIRFVLGHEAGHMICECKSELKADSIAHVMTGIDRPIFKPLE